MQKKKEEEKEAEKLIQITKAVVVEDNHLLRLELH
jgi:hypothetical protein